MCWSQSALHTFSEWNSYGASMGVATELQTQQLSGQRTCEVSTNVVLITYTFGVWWTCWPWFVSLSWWTDGVGILTGSWSNVLRLWPLRSPGALPSSAASVYSLPYIIYCLKWLYSCCNVGGLCGAIFRAMIVNAAFLL